jgi:hypothetical protein
MDIEVRDNSYTRLVHFDGNVKVSFTLTAPKVAIGSAIWVSTDLFHI